MKERIERGLTALGIDAPGGAAALAEYGRLLLEQNQGMNLTAITAPDQVADLHFLDCAALLNAPGISFAGKSLIDVGTGAGFPGLPLRILEPTIRLTLLDSLGKRVSWLEQACTALGAQDVKCLHARAEEQALLPGFRDCFDLAAARAVAPLALLCELCLPFVAVGGFFLAMKSVDCGAELEQAGRCVSRLGGRLHKSWDYEIPGAGVAHRLVIVEKISSTPKGYPRRWAKIQKAPL